MLQLATCHQLIELRERYPQYVVPEEHSWGLKEMGTLFCAGKIHTLRPQWILEVGVGSNTFFDEHFGTQLEYWAIDDTGFFSAEQLAKTQQRPHTRAL